MERLQVCLINFHLVQDIILTGVTATDMAGHITDVVGHIVTDIGVDLVGEDGGHHHSPGDGHTKSKTRQEEH